MAHHIKYEWGPIFLHDFYTRITDANYEKVIHYILTGWSYRSR